MALKVLAPTDLRDFLKAGGWVQNERAVRDRLFVLSHSRLPQRQLVYPMELTAPDYVESVANVLSKLAELTGMTIERLSARVQSVREDVLRIRVYSEGAARGSDNELPLSFASAFVNNTEKMLRAAACTVMRPRLHHPRLTLTEAGQFIDNAKFGQTEEGSFILRVACPLNGMEVQGVLPFPEDDANAPFVRKVTLALRKGLADLVYSIETDTLDRFVDGLKASAAPLVSSNLCEALTALHDETLDNSLDIGVDWSALRPINDDRSSAIRIQRDYFSRIEEVRREMRAVELNREEEFVGTVERLEGEMGDDERRSGGVVLALMLPDEGETVRARIILGTDDYAVADQAHMRSGAYVRVSGKLRPGRQPRQLTDVTHFSMLPAGYE